MSKPYVSFDDMCWPNPKGLSDIEWQLRYGKPTKNDLLVAASVLSSYVSLTTRPVKRSSSLLRQIRKHASSDIISEAGSE